MFGRNKPKQELVVDKEWLSRCDKSIEVLEKMNPNDRLTLWQDALQLTMILYNHNKEVNLVLSSLDFSVKMKQEDLNEVFKFLIATTHAYIQFDRWFNTVVPTGVEKVEQKDDKQVIERMIA